MSANTVKTSFLVLSDTHGAAFKVPSRRVDVAIHCGDLTDESKLAEFRTTLDLLRQLDAPLKLVIAGNHDFTLDMLTFQNRLSEAVEPIEPELVKRVFGDFGQARQLIDDAKDTGIIFLDEGDHQFTLANGASLKVFATPFTPSKSGWGFQYGPETGRQFPISKDTDLIISHGPPLGVMDYTDSRRRAGCPHLFAAVARSRPRMHCFGHIHEGWGAKLVTWRDQLSDQPSHFADIDNSRSIVIDKLANLIPNKFDTPESAKEKQSKARVYTDRGYTSASHCSHDTDPLRPGQQTLFVNASSQGLHPDLPHQPFWIVDIDLSKATD